VSLLAFFRRRKEHERDILLAFLYRLSDNGSRNLTEGEIVRAARLHQDISPSRLDFCQSVEYSPEVEALLSDQEAKRLRAETELSEGKKVLVPLTLGELKFLWAHFQTMSVLARDEKCRHMADKFARHLKVFGKDVPKVVVEP
jgi:hypothetical protein